jgi:hypothetical protein
LLPATDPLLRVIVPYDPSTRLAAARARGDPAAFDRGLAEGQARDIDRAVAAALASPPTRTPTSSSCQPARPQRALNELILAAPGRERGPCEGRLRHRHHLPPGGDRAGSQDGRADRQRPRP